MEPTYLYAAILDLLAYRQHLQQDRESGRLDLQRKMAAALNIFESINEAIFTVQAISDTVIITCPDHDHFPNFLGRLREVFIAFLKEGLFVRGGIAYSRHFQSKYVTYSHAIARAQELESKFAIYPRILIDKNIVSMYASGEKLPKIHSSGLLCVENGLFFLDILTTENWRQIYEYAKSIFQQEADYLASSEEAFGKHLRFQRYLLASPYALTGTGPYIEGIALT